MTTLCDVRDSLPDKLAYNTLYDPDRQCYCVVGWMLHLMGIPDEKLAGMGHPDDLDDSPEGKYAREHGEALPTTQALYDTFGLDYATLTDLISTNDEVEDPEEYEERRNAVYERLDELCPEKVEGNAEIPAST